MSEQFDWNEIITKGVLTTEGKKVGHVDGLETANFIIKQRLFNPHYYKVPNECLDSYESGLFNY